MVRQAITCPMQVMLGLYEFPADPEPPPDT